MTLEQAAAELNITAGALSQHERGETNYGRNLLEALAALYGCQPGDLIMRNPLDTEAVWSLWDQAKKGQRDQIVSMMKIIIGDKAGTGG